MPNILPQKRKRKSAANMAYVNKYDKGGECSVMGHSAEGTFSNIAEARGFKVHKATRHENMHEHWDFSIDRWGNDDDDLVYMQVDVKARKKTSRKDASFNDEWTWLEFKNVRGDPGWLQGSATHIAFERVKDFVIVPREGLRDWSEAEIKRRCHPEGGSQPHKHWAKNARDAKYKYYTRWQREDLLTQVKMADIIGYVKEVQIWKK